MDDYDTQHLNDHISNSSKRLGLKVVPKLSIENSLILMREQISIGYV